MAVTTTKKTHEIPAYFLVSQPWPTPSNRSTIHMLNRINDKKWIENFYVFDLTQILDLFYCLYQLLVSYIS